MTTTSTPPTTRWTRPRLALAVIGALLLGVVGRGIVVDGSDSAFVRWLPWLDRTAANFYFGDPTGEYLVPVTRTLSGDATEPEALLDTLLAGPTPGSGLTTPIPDGTTVESVTLDDDGLLSVDLGGAYTLDAPFLAHEAVLQSLRSWPGVESVVVTVGGTALDSNSSGRLLFFYDEDLDMLVAQPTNLLRPGDVLTAWIEGPGDPRFVGLPDDILPSGVELGANELLTLEFNFEESLRDFAVDHPESVRRVLEGLIATFNTGFPEVGAVLLDFEGQNALGLGQCANLLNTAQTLPDVLNDERLLARYAGT
jgi:hypothetical protein